MKKVTIMATLVLMSFACSFKNVKDEAGSAGVAVAAAEQTKLISKDFVDTYFDVQSSLIRSELKAGKLTADEARGKQSNLNSKLSEAYGILDKLQSMEVLLHEAVMLKLEYEKKGNNTNPNVLAEVTKYSMEVAILISKIANLIQDIQNGGN